MKMEEMEGKSLNRPDEVRTFDKGKLELVTIGRENGGTGHVPTGMEMVSIPQAFGKYQKL